MNCGAIDIGSRQVFTSLDGQSKVLVHSTFTEDFVILSDLLVNNGIKSIAMEATGVYWVVLYEILESKGIDVWLVDGRQTKQLPGRKTDIRDCQWIHQLHSYGLLNRCHFTTGDMKTLRVFQRLREKHIKSKATCINQMQKALTQMNIRLKEVISQIHGASGMAMIKAILNGERDKNKLLFLCHKKIKDHKSELVLKALEGYYKPEYIFELRQAYMRYYFYIEQIQECDKEMNDHLSKMIKNKPNLKSLSKRKAIRHNAPKIENLGEKIVKIHEGIDPLVLPGFTDYTALQLVAEVGADISKWPSAKQFTSWLGLSPGQNNSGRSNRNKKKKGSRRAGGVFKQVANNLINSCRKSAIGEFGRRVKARRGPNIANKAVARKLAERYWRLATHGETYIEMGVKQYNKILVNRKLNLTKKLARELNIQLIQP